MLWFRVVVDLVHDITAGVGPGAVLALWLVRGGAATTVAPAELSTMVSSWSWIVLILFLEVVILVVTGAVRVSYRTHNTREDALVAQGRAALLKHAVFIPLFIFATVVGFMTIQP
jgi:hypothetical protein